MGLRRRWEQRVVLLMLYPSHLSFYRVSSGHPQRSSTKLVDQSQEPRAFKILLPRSKASWVKVEKRSAHHPIMRLTANSTLGGYWPQASSSNNLKKKKKRLSSAWIGAPHWKNKAISPKYGFSNEGSTAFPVLLKSATEASNQPLSLKPGNADLQSL